MKGLEIRQPLSNLGAIQSADLFILKLEETSEYSYAEHVVYGKDIVYRKTILRYATPFKLYIITEESDDDTSIPF